MELDAFNGVDCPICGHLVDSGTHRIESDPNYPLPFLLCPSFSEFCLDADIVLFDQPDS